jgi:hypothetical protein
MADRRLRRRSYVAAPQRSKGMTNALRQWRRAARALAFVVELAHMAALPHLRFLMCQDTATAATDAPIEHLG